MQVLDRDELELPFDGPTVFHDIEGEEELFAEPWAFRRSYQKAMNEFLESVRKDCGARGYDHVRLLDRRVAGRLAQLLLALPRGNRPGHAPGDAFPMITFLSPFLIWGALLGAIPLIIHLLNRRRFRRVEWAPMHYLKLTIQRNRQADSARAALALVVADRPARAVVLLPGAADHQSHGARAVAGHRRPVQPGCLDRRFDEHGLHGRRGVGLSAGAAVGGRAAGGDPPARPLHGGDHLGAPGPGDPRRRGLAARRDLGGCRVRAAHGHARRLAGGARGRRRGLAVVHLSHASSSPS